MRGPDTHIMLFPSGFEIVLKGAGNFLADWWWVFTPPVLLFLLQDMWLLYMRWKYFLSQEFILLEIRLPQIVERTPKAMEQVFAGLHGIWDEIKITDRYFKGTIPDKVSCELISINGESHFIIRLPAKFKNLVEAHVWAQYPDAEISDVEDYVDNIPVGIPDREYEAWGTEFMLSKQDAYPIRTYPYFEETVEERRLDPLSAFLEVMGSVGEGEQIWLQIIVEPTLDDTWKKQGEELVAKLTGKRAKAKARGMGQMLSEELSGLPANVVRGATIGLGEGAAQQQRMGPSEPPSLMMHLSPGERAVVEAIEENIAKLGFITGIRVLYIARREVYNSATIAAIFGAIRQFNTLNLNGFRPDKRTLPKRFYVLQKQRQFFRKRRLLRFYRMRWPSLARFVFNTEELATIFHFPGQMVAQAPLVSRIESKRKEPPSTLPRV